MKKGIIYGGIDVDDKYYHVGLIGLRVKSWTSNSQI